MAFLLPFGLTPTYYRKEEGLFICHHGHNQGNTTFLLIVGRF
ncbi:hypothetical protein TDIS_1588 [Thermosulfurimonas dismutans]|uniref:Uncharacterized protein n=1 Tax=Thermosulfurimonas dismutans TaxID=999894 RepID=A0A179D340_9BACT|nr:hypothetical protein TDIS_1588 [Thermosulfurimonas dismutans]